MLALVSVMIYLVAFVLYNRQVIRGVSKPNAAMWTLWVLLGFLNAASYRVMTGDWVKALITYAGCTALTLTFVLVLKMGKFTRLSVFDWICLVLGLIAAAAWWIKKDATFANLLMQVCMAISFIPTYRGVWRDPRNEGSIPWFLFSTGYVLSIAVVWLRWTGQIQDLVFPINMVLMHSAVGVLSLRRTS